MATLTTPTIEDLIWNVRSMLNQPDPNNSFWSDEELANWLNEAVRRYFAEVVLNNEGLFTTQTDLDITTDTETVALPSDFFEVRALYKKSNTDYIILPYQNDFTDSYTTQGGSSATSYFPYYYFRGNNLVLRPVPNFSETDGLRLEYIQFPTTMLLGGDTLTNQVSPIFRDLIEMYAVYKAKLKESLVAGTNLYNGAAENLESLYTAFKNAIEGRSKYPQFTSAFNPEEN